MKHVVKHLGRQPYEPIYRQMREFTLARADDTPDELWFLEHDPVFTQGQAGKAEHVLAAADIPVVQSDRGGQVTYDPGKCHEREGKSYTPKLQQTGRGFAGTDG